MRLPRVVVVGGGITGLATAWYLRRMAQERGPSRCPFEVMVLEAAPRAGGKLRTEHRDGFLVEAGPDSFLTGKPAAVDLCRDLGLADALIPQREPRGAYVARRGRLVPIPQGMRLVHPGRPWAFLRSPLLSLPGRLRALAHPLVPERQGGGDESVGAFVQRRYGVELLRVLGEPLLAGIHLADPWRLSLGSTFPALRAPMRRSRPAATVQSEPARLRGSPFASLKGGMEQLVDALRARLAGCLQLGTEVTSVVPAARGYHVHLRNGPDVPAAAAVVVTTPAAVAAELVSAANRPLSTLLAGAEAASSAIVTLGYREPGAALPLPGSGFLVPRDEDSRLLACTWSSAKWAGRTPAGGVLLRGFVGGWRDPDLLDLRDEELIALVQDELSVTLGRSFSRSHAPAVSRVHRWPAGTPLYRVGHAEWLAEVRSACVASPGLWLAGAPYDGVGIPDCIRQARETAAAVAANLIGGGRA